MAHDVVIKKNCHNCPNSIPSIDEEIGMRCDWGENIKAVLKSPRARCCMFYITKEQADDEEFGFDEI